MSFRREVINNRRKTDDHTDRLLNKMNERIRSLKRNLSRFSPMDLVRTDLSGKASFCTPVRRMRRASLAVETAMVLPVFFLGLVTMISFMDVYKLQTEHLAKLCERAKQAGMYAYVLNGSGQDEITLPDLYAYQPVGGLVPLPKVWMHNSVKVHAWTGREYEAFQAEGETEEMVYVTETGNVYHRDLGCNYLDLSVREAAGSQVGSMRNDYGERYTACETCSRNQAPAGIVYVTGKGNRYHNLETCSGLKRTVRMVGSSHVDGMAACSRCG